MVKIRLSQTGKKNQRKYRIVAIDQRKKRDGRAIEILGFYNPLTVPPEVKFDQERINYWLSRGARMSEKVKELTGQE